MVCKMPTMVGKSPPSEYFMALSYVVKLGPIVSGDRAYEKDEIYAGTDIPELLASGRIAITGSADQAPPIAPTIVEPEESTDEAEESTDEAEEAPVVTDLSGLNAMDAKRAIDACDDVELLQSWIATDSRSPIRKAINDRLTALSGSK